MLAQSNLPNSYFDVALLGVSPPYTSETPLELLVEILRILKPSRNVVIGSSEPDAVLSSLRLSGFSDAKVSIELHASMLITMNSHSCTLKILASYCRFNKLFHYFFANLL